MKKFFITLSLSLLTIAAGFSYESRICHSYSADSSLFPDTIYTEYYKNKLASEYPVRYCVQSVFDIQKNEANGYTCEQILNRLDQLGGLEKECFGVSYLDANTGARKAVFKKSRYDNSTHELYIKDKSAGGLYFNVNVDKYNYEGNLYIVRAILSKTPDNFFVRGIKKKEAEIFVLMQEKSDTITVYSLMQCSYNPLNHKFIKSYVENAVTARVGALQEWFYRMLCKQ